MTAYYLYCENGWSDTRNDISQLMKNAVLDNREQRITGDTLWYDERSGEGEGFGKVTHHRHHRQYYLRRGICMVC
ncbi:MAG: hypothetical protein U5L72_18240 [Bacteroidales bacterium]|nr:hypothetical protein [Bacteroidales bacterium]